MAEFVQGRPAVASFSDEFEGSALDTSVWSTAYWWGRGDVARSELQYYAEDAFVVRDSVLRIVAERRARGPFAFTSGIITSLGQFAGTYGRYEVRARVPAGRGLFPAVWLLHHSRAHPFEVDIFEVLGNDPCTVHMTHHWRDTQGAMQQRSGSYMGPDFSAAFHTFAVEWRASSLVWFVDGTERFRSEIGVPDRPLYVLANLAVGGPWAGSPDAQTRFPTTLDIDYVRVSGCASVLRGDRSRWDEA